MEISWLPSNWVKKPARLGLTHIPGMQPRQRDEDLDALVRLGITHIIAFVEEEEFAWLEPEETLLERTHAITERGMSFFHRPIVDYEAPSLHEAKQTIAYIEQILAQGGTVLLHCWAGLGRAGTLAACFLVSQGMDPGEAIDLVREVRTFAIQSEEQEDFIYLFSQKDLNT